MTVPGGVPPIPPAVAPARRRPFALLVLAGLLLVKAGTLLAVLLDLNFRNGPIGNMMRLSPELGRIIGSFNLADAVIALLAVLLIGAAIGLLLLRRDGWLLAMVMTGVFVAGDILGFVEGNVAYLWMALNIVTVFYLNAVEVRAAVGVSTEPLVPIATEP